MEMTVKFDLAVDFSSWEDSIKMWQPNAYTINNIQKKKQKTQWVLRTVNTIQGAYKQGRP